MGNKAPLIIIEQLVMILTFALVATFCIQIFIKADEISRRSRERDKAVIAVQNEAEKIALGGTSQSGKPGLEYFTLSYKDTNGNVLFEVEVARQVE